MSGAPMPPGTAVRAVGSAIVVAGAGAAGVAVADGTDDGVDGTDGAAGACGADVAVGACGDVGAAGADTNGTRVPGGGEPRAKGACGGASGALRGGAKCAPISGMLSRIGRSGASASSALPRSRPSSASPNSRSGSTTSCESTRLGLPPCIGSRGFAFGSRSNSRRLLRLACASIAFSSIDAAARSRSGSSVLRGALDGIANGLKSSGMRSARPGADAALACCGKSFAVGAGALGRSRSANVPASGREDAGVATPDAPGAAGLSSAGDSGGNKDPAASIGRGGVTGGPSKSANGFGPSAPAPSPGSGSTAPPSPRSPVPATADVPAASAVAGTRTPST